VSRIGLDLDNTIIDYEAIIREEVAALGVLPVLPPGDKRILRDALRDIPQGEEHWVRVQARVYGPRLDAAVPFPGAVDFIKRATRAGHELWIVSHKTPLAAADESGCDLRAAANRWLAARGIVGRDAIPAQRVFYESTRAEKLSRIATLGLHAFLDDLLEVFDEPDFPTGVARWLFSPEPSGNAGVDRIFRSWAELERFVLDDG
jgi:hypothetical protein